MYNYLINAVHQTIYNYLQKGQQSVSNSKLRIVDLKTATVGSDLVVLGREFQLQWNPALQAST